MFQRNANFSAPELRLCCFILIFNLQFDTRVPFWVKILSNEEPHSNFKHKPQRLNLTGKLHDKIKADVSDQATTTL